jgi:hypothetical protein
MGKPSSVPTFVLQYLLVVRRPRSQVVQSALVDVDGVCVVALLVHRPLVVADIAAKPMAVSLKAEELAFSRAVG